MTLTPDRVLNYLTKPITGILHVGAHECEERDIYHQLGLTDQQIIWVEAMPHKVYEMKEKIPSLHLYQAVVSDQDDQEVVFHETNNGQSSSYLALGTHSQRYPHITVQRRWTAKTTRLDTLFEREQIEARPNFLILDIQGTELPALKGLGKLLDSYDYLILEVSFEELYQGQALVTEIDTFLGGQGIKRVLTCNTGLGWGDAFYMRQA